METRDSTLRRPHVDADGVVYSSLRKYFIRLTVDEQIDLLVGK